MPARKSTAGPRVLHLTAGMLLLAALGCIPVEAQVAAEALNICRSDAGPAAARIAACTRAVEEAAGDETTRIEAFLQRGILHEEGGEWEAAVRDYTEAIKLDGTNATAYFNRGNAYDQLGQVDLAIADYTQAIKLDPTDPDFYNNRGQIY